MKFIPRRESSRKQVTATREYNPSDPWGDAPAAPRTGSTSDPRIASAHKRKTASLKKANGPKPGYTPNSGSEDQYKDRPSYRNDID